MSLPVAVPLPNGLVELFQWPDGTCTLQINTDVDDSPIRHDLEEPRLRVYVNDALVTHPSGECCSPSCDHSPSHRTPE